MVKWVYLIFFQHFNSRPHEEVDTDWFPAYGGTEAFQLTTSRRGRPRKVHRLHGSMTHFNSRPHEEVDVISVTVDFCQKIFQLTTSRRGRRQGVLEWQRDHKISTHDLTKRSTVCWICARQSTWYFNSRPHEEVDEREQINTSGTCHFNSRPHEEVDWHDILLLGIRRKISTHDLTKRSTEKFSALSATLKFQLTTSRRGRRCSNLA